MIASATFTLAEFVANLRFEALPETVRRQAARCLLDAVACALIGTHQRASSVFARYVAESGVRADAGLLGRQQRASVEQAAFYNAAAMRVLELDDTHPYSGIHPGCVLAATALALAESTACSGRELLTALVAGYEVTLRVGLALTPITARRGFHPTGVVGALGAAAVAARLMRLESEQVRLALGSAATSAGGLFQFEPEGGDSFMSNPLNAARAAAAGVASARLTRLGLGSTRFSLEGERGFMAAFGERANAWQTAALAVESLGQPFTIEQLDFTPYACCRHARSPVEAALALRRETGLAAEQVASIEVATYDAAVSGFCQREQLWTEFDALLSVSYGVAAAWLDGQMSPAQLALERINDPRLSALRQRVQVVPDEQLDAGYPERNPARLRLQTTDGRGFEHAVDSSRGTRGNPFDESDWQRKFSSLAGPTLPSEQVGRAYELIMSLEQEPSAVRLFEALEVGQAVPTGGPS